jgi:hypothetical protein
MINNFYKTKTVYQVLELINAERELLKSDFVAYSNDPIRFKRRFRMLINLAEYELNILNKIQQFESIDPKDFDHTTLNLVKQEIKNIVNRNA